MRRLLCTGMTGLAGAVLAAGACAPAAAQAPNAAPATQQAAVSAPRSTPLDVGASVQSRLAPGASAVYTLNLPAGQVVQGFFESAGATLDLQDAQGRHLRRLGRASGAAEPFMWITRGAGQERLVATADAAGSSTAGAYTLALTKALAQAPALPARRHNPCQAPSCKRCNRRWHKAARPMRSGVNARAPAPPWSSRCRPRIRW